MSGKNLGAALAEVNSHCAESRESAQQVFGDPVTIMVGDLGLWGTLAAVIVIFAWQVRPLTNLVMRRPVVATLGLMTVMIVMLLPIVLWQEPVAEFSVLSALTFGGTFLIVGTVWELVRVRAEAAEEEIARPLDSSAELKRRSRSSRRMHYVRIFVFPVISGLLIAVVMLVG